MAVLSSVAVCRTWPWRLFAAAVVSILTYFAARVVLEIDTLATGWRIATALAPMPFFVWVLYEIVRSSRQLDEMQRRIHLEALAIAYPLALTLLMLLGLLELAVPLDPDNWSYRHIWQMQGVIYILSLFIVQRRYGVAAE